MTEPGRAGTGPLRRSNRRLSLVLRLLVAAAVLVLLLRIVDWPALWILFGAVRPGLLVLAVLVIFAGAVVTTYRWHLLLRGDQPTVRVPTLLKCNLISWVAGIVAPTNLANEFVRVFYLTRRHADAERAISSILADRMVGSVSLGLAAAASCLWIGLSGTFSVGTPVVLGIATLLLASILVPLSLLSRRTAAIGRGVLERLGDRAWLGRVRQLFESLVAYRDRGPALATALGVSILAVYLAAAEFYLVARAFSATAPFLYFALFMPIAFFLSMVPVSLGGFGLMETALVVLFTRAGLSLEVCLAIVLVHKALFLLTILPGGWFYVVEGFPAKRLPPEPVGLER